MGDYIINLKNIYRIIRINDYPVYSDGIFPRTRLKGLTLIKFWTQFLLPRWRNTEHGRVIWRTQGSKNRYHSELCNRKHSFPFYKEYSDEIVSILTEKEFYDQVLVFMDFLKLHKYNHDNFRKKLEKDLESTPFDEKQFKGRGFLSAEKLAIAEAYRGKPVSVTEIRLCPYMYWCSINAEFGWGKMKIEEYPIREEWQGEAGILEPDKSIPTFTEYGRKFVEFILKWAYPKDYLEMVKGV